MSGLDAATVALGGAALTTAAAAAAATVAGAAGAVGVGLLVGSIACLVVGSGKADAETARFAAFAPKQVAPKQDFTVGLWVFLPEDQEEVTNINYAEKPKREQLAQQDIGALPKGTQVYATLRSNDVFAVISGGHSATKRLTWNGSKDKIEWLVECKDMAEPRVYAGALVVALEWVVDGETVQKELYCEMEVVSQSAQIVVSAPEFGPDASGGYTLPVMELIQELSVHQPTLTVGYDWANSSNRFGTDKTLWDQIFEPPATDAGAGNKSLVQLWKEAAGGEQAEVLEKIRGLVKCTQWFAAYKGQIKGAARIAALQGRNVLLVCVEGGPITRVEQLEMSAIKMEIDQDLRQLKKYDASIQIVTYSSIADLQNSFGTATSGRRRTAVECVVDGCTQVRAW
jgi:hypothetical protein